LFHSGLPVSCAIRDTISEYSPTIHAAALRTCKGVRVGGVNEIRLGRGWDRGEGDIDRSNRKLQVKWMKMSKRLGYRVI
jgi:hypothetical protein